MSTPGATATGLSLDTGLIPVSSSSIPELVGLPLIFGFILTMLYGVTSVQTYIYFYNNLHDSRVLKRTIFFLWIIDTLLIIFNSISVYYYCVKVLMKPLLLTKLPWADGVGIILASLSDFIVTGIFAYRIRILCGRIWPLAFVIPPATLSFFVGTAVGIMALVMPDFGDLRRHVAWMFYVTFSLQAFADIAIMVSLCTILLRQHSTVRKTRSVIGLLVFYSVNTCLLTSSIGVAAVVTNAVLPNKFYWQGLTVMLPKLMLNSLLAMLNTRDSMRKKMMPTTGALSIHLTQLGRDRYSLEYRTNVSERLDTNLHAQSTTTAEVEISKDSCVEGSPDDEDAYRV